MTRGGDTDEALCIRPAYRDERAAAAAQHLLQGDAVPEASGRVRDDDAEELGDRGDSLRDGGWVEGDQASKRRTSCLDEVCRLQVSEEEAAGARAGGGKSTVTTEDGHIGGWNCSGVDEAPITYLAVDGNPRFVPSYRASSAT